MEFLVAMNTIHFVILLVINSPIEALFAESEIKCRFNKLSKTH